MNAAAPRRVLFLQGLASAFFRRLGTALEARGHAVHRVNLNGGDKLFWRRPDAIDYRGTLEEWPAALGEILETRRITDIVLFGDCRPLHRVAIKLAAHRAIPVHVFEEGYLRPSWITLELGGVNANSSLPRDAKWYRTAASTLPPFEAAPSAPSSFLRRSVEDVAYNVATVALSWRFAGYRTHRPWHPFVEYAGWLAKFARQPFTRRRSERLMQEIAGSRDPLYLFPLQLDCDYQVREHSPFGRLEPAIDQVVTSFARHAPPDSRLIVKEHPLDNGLTDWLRVTERLATARGVAHRIVYLHEGDLATLLRRARAVVTINSTVGTLALGEGLPVIALGPAIYNFAGLTYQGELDDFWRHGTPADPALFDAFRRVIGARSLVYGGFFSEQALAAAVGGSIARIEAAAAHTSVVVPDRAGHPLAQDGLAAVPFGATTG
ncbi:MAG TPA: capsular biosynthesis protein [Stellaceae bacterium]|nr:capsular biosynthesis protein [Stellaceae bacterium]